MQEATHRMNSGVGTGWGRLQRPEAYSNRREHSTFVRTSKQWSVLVVAALLLVLIGIFFTQTQQENRKNIPGFTLQSLYHFTGGFSIETVDRVANAAADGIQVDLKYGNPYTPKDPVGAALQAKRIKLIDSIPETYLYY